MKRVAITYGAVAVALTCVAPNQAAAGTTLCQAWLVDWHWERFLG